MLILCFLEREYLSHPIFPALGHSKTLLSFLGVFCITSSQIHLVEFFSILFHHHSSLPQILYLLMQRNLVFFGKKPTLHLGYHSWPFLNWKLIHPSPLYLDTIPPQGCVSFHLGCSKFNSLIFADLLTFKIFVQLANLVQQYFCGQTTIVIQNLRLWFAASQQD